MMVLLLEKVPAGLRGELSRGMIEPRCGVFLGCLSGMVRDRIWEHAKGKAQCGGGILIYTSNNEQGFSIRTFGPTDRLIEDFDGISLVRTP